MDDFFKTAEIGIKTLNFPDVDDALSISINGCFSIKLKTKIQSEDHNFSIIYKGTKYLCDEKISKYFIKLDLANNNIVLNLPTNQDSQAERNESIKEEKNENINDEVNEDVKNEKSENSNSNNNNNEKSENSEQLSLDETKEKLSSSDTSYEDNFAKELFTKFFNGHTIEINGDNYTILEFLAQKENLNIPCFLKICDVFNRFFELYDKMNPIADIQYDLINISENIGFDENQYEILRNDSIESIDPDFDQEDKIQQISSFGSLRSLEFPTLSFSFNFMDKIKDAIDDLVDRIANEPELANDPMLLYNILMKAALYRPENAKFYVSIIKKLNDPEPEGKGIKLDDIIRELYLNKINSMTDFFLLHELMIGGILTRKEILDVVKDSTNLEFKIWFAPYIEEEEAERANQNANDNNNNNSDGNNDYSGIIQDIEDYIYSIPDAQKRAFKAHFFSSIRENNWALHKVLARQGANHTPIARAIRRDDSKKLQKILAFNSNSTVDDVIKWSAFDHIPFIMNSPTLIQYAAFYGSVKCFKYLMLNNATLDKLDDNKQPLINFAVAGGNSEIVRICMQKKLPTYSIISPSCLFYRFDMLDWILENVFPTMQGFIPKFKSLQISFLSSLDSFNFISILKLFQFIDKNSLLKAAAVDNEIILNILNLFKFDREDKIYMLLSSTESYNFEFFKRLFNTLNIKRRDDNTIESDDSTLEANEIDDGNDGVDDGNDDNHNVVIDANNQNNNNINNENIAEVNDNDVEEDDPDHEELMIQLIQRLHEEDDDNDGDEDDNKPFTLDDSNISTLLFQAIFNDNAELLEFIEDNICKIDLYRKITDEVKYDIIELSVIYGAIQCLKYITNRPDFNVEMWNQDGYSILRLAILYNQSVILKFLLSFEGLNVNNTENGGGSAFTAATWDNQIPLVKILYKHGGVDINMKGKLGETPLTGTVLQQIPKMMELLLSFPEINVYEPNKDNKTPMMLCLEKNSIECFFTLIQSDKFDINSPKSCFDCTTAVFCLKSSKISLEMIQITMNTTGINLNEMYNGDTVKNQLQKKISNMKNECKNDKDDNNNDNNNK